MTKKKTIFLANKRTKEVHRVPDGGQVSGSCQLDEIKQVQFFTTLKAAMQAGRDRCGFCFHTGSKR